MHQNLPGTHTTTEYEGKLKQYELLYEIHRESMGTILCARHKKFRGDIALKVLPSLEKVDRRERRKFVKDFNHNNRAISELQHPNIVPTLDYGVSKNHPYIAMTFLKGGSLAQRIDIALGNSEILLPSPIEVADCLDMVAHALDHSYSKGIVHRDIKPHNIMFDQQGTPFLVDFGVAAIKNDKKSSKQNNSNQSGIGTYPYMPPEQWTGEPITGAADQYAMAIVVFQMLTGQVMFDGNDPAEYRYAHMTLEPHSVRAVQTHLPARIDNVLTKALAKNPLDRYPSVQAFAEGFRQAIVNYEGKDTGFFIFPIEIEEIEVYQIPAEPPKYKLFVITALIIAIVALVGGTIFYLSLRELNAINILQVTESAAFLQGSETREAVSGTEMAILNATAETIRQTSVAASETAIIVARTVQYEQQGTQNALNEQTQIAVETRGAQQLIEAQATDTEGDILRRIDNEEPGYGAGDGLCTNIPGVFLRDTPAHTSAYSITIQANEPVVFLGFNEVERLSEEFEIRFQWWIKVRTTGDNPGEGWVEKRLFLTCPLESINRGGGTVPVLPPQPSPRQTPTLAEESVRSYFSLINNRQFSEAFERLTPRYQCYSNYIDGYSAFWSGYTVEITSTNPTTSTNSEATIYVAFILIDNGTGSGTSYERYYQMRNDGSGRWLFEDGTLDAEGNTSPFGRDTRTECEQLD